MKTKELKKLEVEFCDFIVDSTLEEAEDQISEFWFAKFGCNNTTRETELFNFIEKKNLPAFM